MILDALSNEQLLEYDFINTDVVASNRPDSHEQAGYLEFFLFLQGYFVSPKLYRTINKANTKKELDVVDYYYPIMQTPEKFVIENKLHSFDFTKSIITNGLFLHDFTRIVKDIKYAAFEYSTSKAITHDGEFIDVNKHREYKIMRSANTAVDTLQIMYNCYEIKHLDLLQHLITKAEKDAELNDFYFWREDEIGLKNNDLIIKALINCNVNIIEDTNITYNEIKESFIRIFDKKVNLMRSSRKALAFNIKAIRNDIKQKEKFNDDINLWYKWYNIFHLKDYWEEFDDVEVGSPS